jgi:eukaryotic-like serine/threonine-protein kinase
MADPTPAAQPPDEAQLAAALAIADGTPVDWSVLGRTGVASSAAASAIEATPGLLHLERVVRGHRELRARDGGAGAGADTLLTAARRESVLRSTELQVRWGPLLVLEKIGRGSFGDVYRAWDPRLDREVALKLLREDTTERFGSPAVEEGRLLARVRHPNVVTVFGAERAAGRAGIWMEYIRGRTLADEVKDRGPLAPDEAVRIAIDVCRALAAVHAANLLHRDVKAHNVMREENGRIVLGDFGTGLTMLETPAEPQLAGTPLYLAPEVLEQRIASVASDLYSVGVLLFFLLTGRYPVAGGSLAEIQRAHSDGVRLSVREAGPELDHDLAALVETLLDPDPGQRFPTAIAAEAALQQWRDRQAGETLPGAAAPPRAGRFWMGAAFLTATASVASVAWLSQPSSGTRFGGGAGIVPANAPVTRQIVNHACSGMPAADGSIACIELLTHLLDRGGSMPPPLVLYRPLTGEMRVLRQPTGDELLDSAVIAPDGTRVAYTFRRPPDAPEIRVLDLGGGVDRSLAPLPDWASTIAVIGWSASDGQVEARVWGRDGTHHLALLSPDTGSIASAFRFPTTPQTFSRSPDGRLVAFDARQDETAPERDIRLCDLGSSTCATVVSHPANDMSPVWAPDGRLFFVSDRSGLMGLWSVALDGVTARDPPVLVRDSGRSRPMPIGFAADGTLFYDLVVDEFDIYTAALDESAMTPIRASLRAVDMNKEPEWSPDGRRLAYVSRRGPFAETGATQVVIQDVEHRTERAFRLDIRPNMTRLAWSPDGTMLALRTPLGPTPATWVFGIHLLSVDDGRVVKSLTRRNPPERYFDDQIGDLAWLDASTILFSSHRGIRRFDVVTGLEHQIWSPPPGEVAYGLSVSPDGHWMAIQTIESVDDRLRSVFRTVVVPTAGGAAHEVLRVDPPGGAVVQAWTRDGAALLVVRWASGGFRERRSQLWRVPVSGGDATPLPLIHRQIAELTVHPGGEEIAFMMGAPSTEFWVMTGLTAP